MNTRTRALFLGLGLPCLGCHVLERADQCRALADHVNVVRPALLAAKLPPEPSAEILRKRASIYGRLGSDLEGVVVEAESVDTERRNVVGQLRALETHLNAAATAVQKEKEATARLAQDAKAVTEKAMAEKAASAPQRPASAEAQQATSIQPEKGTARVGARHSVANAPRYSLHVREYSQARRVAETAGRSLVSAIDRLERECR